MTIKLQGKWEAERVANALEYAAARTDMYKDLAAWATDCAARIKRQVEQEKERRETKRCCSTCKWLAGEKTLEPNCIKNEQLVVPEATFCGQWRMK